MKVPTHLIYRSFIIISKELVIDLANKSTFIKIDRNIQNWGWYQNANTFRVFIHCLIEARITAGTWQGVPINRGEFPTSYEKIARTLNLTVSEVRTAISHLKSTGEIATKNYSKFQVISIVNYGYYQDKSAGKSTGNQQSLNIQFTVKSQHLKNDKNDKNVKNDNIYNGDKSDRFVPPTLEEVQNYCLERGNNVDAETFVDFYSSKGWMVGKNKMKDWKAAVRTWERKEQKPPNKAQNNGSKFMETMMKMYNED